MANIKLKDVNQLEAWNPKELRKLKMATNNYISSLETSIKPKKLGETHPLFRMKAEQCKELLIKIINAEKKLKS